ncbi:ATP-dependent DNA helicase PIF1, partial [Brachionus plicatilis]
MPVSRTSRETIYVNTFPSKERNVILKEDRYLEIMNPESKNIFRAGILQHYVNRPIEMERMCLAEFATYFDYLSREKAKDPNDLTRVGRFQEEEDENLDEDDNNYYFENEQLARVETNTGEDDDVSDTVEIASNSKLIKLKNNDGYVKKRNKCKILRYKRYNRIKDPENYYRVEIMLFH